MTKLRKKITVENLYIISDFFETLTISEFRDSIDLISIYLQDGYKYACNVKDQSIKKLSISQYIDILDTLKICAESMMEAENYRHCSMSLSKDKSINLEPFFDLLETLESMSYNYTDILTIEKVMKNFLHSSNIIEYKQGSEMISELAGTIKHLYEEFES